ncbi:MAG: DmsE family decaheme c-type cytochrome [Acidobacteriota bacterium]
MIRSRKVVGKLLLAFLLPGAAVMWAYARQKAAPERVGRDLCLECHDDLPSVFFRSAHGKTECEDCHTPGSEHIDAGGDLTLSFDAQPPAWGLFRCLSCHRAQDEFAHFVQSAHGGNGVACISCHRIHAEKPSLRLLKSEENPLCASCHLDIMASFRKPFHHPVLEDAMRCVDCHNPHSESRRPLLRLEVGTEQVCVSCHSDKNGPFIFEHAPLQITGCQRCHQPHGSINPKMLRRTQVSQLCLECHSRTPGVLTAQPFAFHDQRSPRFRNCTVCHREIHGSNVSSKFFR